MKTKSSDPIPECLHVMQYGLHILEEVLGWPAKGNQELMADCLSAIAKSKKLTNIHAYKYMVRAINLAKAEGQELTRMWLMDGAYMNVRPPVQSQKLYEPIDWKKVKEHQSSPEFDAAWNEMIEKCSRLFGIPKSRRDNRGKSGVTGHRS